MRTNNISYFCSFDNFKVGTKTKFHLDSVTFFRCLKSLKNVCRNIKLK